MSILAATDENLGNCWLLKKKFKKVPIIWLHVKHSKVFQSKFKKVVLLNVENGDFLKRLKVGDSL